MNRTQYFECVHKWKWIPYYSGGNVVRRTKICMKCGHGSPGGKRTAYNTQRETSEVGQP
jgi:hypothetical protein